MRVVICGDSHIGAIFGLGGPNGLGGNTRVDDYQKTINHIVDYCIQNEIDVFIQTGDAFEQRKPKPEYLDILSQAIKRLSMANIFSAVIMGNHDYIRNSEGFTSAISSMAAKDYPNVRLVTKPESILISNGNREKVNLVLLPYRDRRMYSGKSTQEDSLLYQEEAKSIISGCDFQAPIVAVGHNFYYQGSYHDFNGTEVLIDVDTFDKCDLVAMGHYHQFKILRKKNPIAIYTGSMEKINFGDMNIDKYFIDYNTENKRVKIIKSPVRELLEVNVNLADCTYDNLFSSLKSELQKYVFDKKITRAKISIKDKMLPFLKKSEIEALLYELGSFYVSRVTIETIFTRIVRDDAILKHKDDFLMFKAFIDEQELDEQDKQEILIKAKKVIDQEKNDSD